MALGLVAAATLMLQIIETRIISVVSWYHLAFFVISIAMFGLTAGAVFVYLRRERYRPERLSYDLTVATLAFALTTNLAILVQLTLVTGDQRRCRHEAKSHIESDSSAGFAPRFRLIHAPSPHTPRSYASHYGQYHRIRVVPESGSSRLAVLFDAARN
jgi:hypothetical protein